MKHNYGLEQLGFGLALLVAGCNSHEGGLSSAKAPEAKPAGAAVKPVGFMYLPKPGTYHYAQLTKSTSTAGPGHDLEMDFTLEVTKHADRFVSVGTVQSSLVDGATPPNRAGAAKGFKVVTEMDPHGKIVSSKVTDPGGILLPGSKDLGASFEFPTQLLKPGDSWSQDIGDSEQPFVVTYTFKGITTEGGRRVATFEKLAADKEGNKTDQPTVIKVDAATGIVLDKTADATMKVGKDAQAQIVTIHSETKLRS